MNFNNEASSAVQSFSTNPKEVWGVSAMYIFSSQEQKDIDIFLHEKVFTLYYSEKIAEKCSVSEIIDIFKRIERGDLESIYALDKTLQAPLAMWCSKKLEDPCYFSQCKTRKELLNRLSSIPYMLGSMRWNRPQQVYLSGQLAKDVREYFLACDKGTIDEATNYFIQGITSHLSLRDTVVRLGKHTDELRHYAYRVAGILS